MQPDPTIELGQRSMRLREIQHTLRFSSPSLVLHHLAKLIEADLVQKDAYGDYSVKRNGLTFIVIIL